MAVEKEAFVDKRPKKAISMRLDIETLEQLRRIADAKGIGYQEDSSYDEILREMAFARMVERGLSDSDAGHTIGNDELKRRINWRKVCWPFLLGCAHLGLFSEFDA